MTENTEDPAADIAWMRRLAEEGAQAPMRGNSLLMFGGLLYGIASLFHWGIIVDLVPLGADQVWIGWVAATLAYWVILAITIPRLRRAGVSTTANRAAGIAWSGMGWGIFAMFVAMSVLGWRLADEAALNAIFALIPSIIMVFYGVGWAVHAEMQRSRSLWVLSLSSFAAAPVLALFADQAEQYLAYAAALFLLMALPGWLLMRQARA
ncbi:MAG: hypothetical protein KKC29_11385 [Alphaproteobacteria bacterium]|jgi:hypothetical protein|nr:hypothetical protein [Alphaproteobacteria bacterium]MBU2040447.1 hypothetical protein [Alphaproteobacteria bacterium]MBU2124840.1 hypothetical protein [Alphaproteobacteria bacterium]MBU2209096.1 hypothetical protein [Alphaproteobacteria bacterium]MBU2291688.1 hypothetical protein [Alphaproteobacteria bacterium]